MGELHIITKWIFVMSLAMASSALDYFPEGYFASTDVTNVTWAHAVNSKQLLDTNLKDSKVQMLEADLVMGTLADSNETTVIMAHPPTNTSDLSFEMFLNQTMEYNRNLTVERRKGIKLDFKEFPAVESSLALLARFNESNPELLRFPIWINADILPGPVNASSTVNVNGTLLIQLQKQYLPRSTLSLGWTTRLQDDVKNGSYTREQVDEMANLIKAAFTNDTEKANAQVTFPLRAGIALNSITNIKYFLDEAGINFTSPSVTLWEGASDPKLNITELEQFKEAIHKSRVFLDLPYSLGNDTSASLALFPNRFIALSLVSLSFVMMLISR
ncbi:hypothetical protein Ocin01_05469 [Orchesella cincta]|uniref:Menorin-like domain-containing protein n=1 Tax=Orchesella cincta TaxID=48709 RepID=A0A1D2N7Z3_ORCCI|nr:hypothetical protein Ocin01_05469 [Orchesella cincta]